MKTKVIKERCKGMIFTNTKGNEICFVNKYDKFEGAEFQCLEDPDKCDFERLETEVKYCNDKLKEKDYFKLKDNCGSQFSKYDVPYKELCKHFESSKDLNNAITKCKENIELPEKIPVKEVTLGEEKLELPEEIPVEEVTLGEEKLELPEEIPVEEVTLGEEKLPEKIPVEEVTLGEEKLELPEKIPVSEDIQMKMEQDAYDWFFKTHLECTSHYQCKGSKLCLKSKCQNLNVLSENEINNKGSHLKLFNKNKDMDQQSDEYYKLAFKNSNVSKEKQKSARKSHNSIRKDNTYLFEHKDNIDEYLKTPYLQKDCNIVTDKYEKLDCMTNNRREKIKKFSKGNSVKYAYNHEILNDYIRSDRIPKCNYMRKQYKNSDPIKDFYKNQLNARLCQNQAIDQYLKDSNENLNDYNIKVDWKPREELI